MSANKLETASPAHLEGIEIKLGVPICTSLVVGNMVGSGIFVLPATMASLGSYVFIPWIIACLVALGLAVLFARLSSRSPEAGGPMSYAFSAFGTYTGGIIAWSYWLSIVIGNSSVAYTLAYYLGELVPALRGSAISIVAIAAIWLLSALNMLTVTGAARLQLVSTVLKLIPLIILLIFALPQLDTTLLAVPAQPLETFSIFPLAGFIIWAFVGLESATVAADITKNPAKTIPRATVIGTLLVCLLYLCIILATTGTVPAEELAGSSAPLALVAAKTMGPKGGLIVTIAGILCMLAALNGFILVSGYLARSAARKGVFPRRIGVLSGGGNTPVHAFLAGAMTSTLFILLSTRMTLLDEFTLVTALATTAIFIPYAFSCAAEVVSCWRQGKSGTPVCIAVSILSVVIVLHLILAVMMSKNSIYFGLWIIFVVLLGLVSGKKGKSENTLT